jgi:hypothetical protein
VRVQRDGLLPELLKPLIVEVHVGLADDYEAALVNRPLDRFGDEPLQNVALNLLLVARPHDGHGRVPLAEAGHADGARVLRRHALEFLAHLLGLDLDLDLLARLRRINHLCLHKH